MFCWRLNDGVHFFFGKYFGTRAKINGFSPAKIFSCWFSRRKCNAKPCWILIKPKDWQNTVIWILSYVIVHKQLVNYLDFIFLCVKISFFLMKQNKTWRNPIFTLFLFLLSFIKWWHCQVKSSSDVELVIVQQCWKWNYSAQETDHRFQLGIFPLHIFVEMTWYIEERSANTAVSLFNLYLCQ